MNAIARRTVTRPLILLPTIMALLLVVLHFQPSGAAIIAKGEKEGGKDNTNEKMIIQDVNGAGGEDDENGMADAAGSDDGSSNDDNLLPADIEPEDKNKSSSGSAHDQQHGKSWGGKAKRDIMILSMSDARQSAGDERFCHKPFRDCNTNCPRNRCWCTSSSNGSPSFCWV